MYTSETLEVASRLWIFVTRDWHYQKCVHVT